MYDMANENVINYLMRSFQSPLSMYTMYMQGAPEVLKPFAFVSFQKLGTMNYPKKQVFNLYQLRHCAYITYSVKTWFLKNLSVPT